MGIRGLPVLLSLVAAAGFFLLEAVMGIFSP